MKQSLIDKLWKHTDNNEKGNVITMKPSLVDETLRKKNFDAPPLLPARLFFSDASSELFLSFHHEESNMNMHYHDFFELIYICKGSPVGVINDQEIQLQEGNLCIMNPNAVHYFKKYTEETDLILNIVLPKDLFQKSIFRVLFHDPVLNAFFIRYQLENEMQPSFLYLEHLDSDIDYFIEILIKEYLDKQQYSHVILESLLTLIFSFILRNYKENWYYVKKKYKLNRENFILFQHASLYNFTSSISNFSSYLFGDKYPQWLCILTVL